MSEQENDKKRQIIKCCCMGSVKLLWRLRVKQYNLSSTKDKLTGRRPLAHPVLRCLRHLTQLTLEVDVYVEVQVPLQANTNQSDNTVTHTSPEAQQREGDQGGARLTLFLRFGFMVIVPKISSPVFTVRYSSR